MSELKTLGDRFKALESKSKLDPTKYTILRVDGNCFHTFTKKFDKPCDESILKAMRQASWEWLKHFKGSVVYTQSDEATLLLPPVKAQAPIDVSDAVEKNISVADVLTGIQDGTYVPMTPDEIEKNLKAEAPKEENKNPPSLMFDGRISKLETLSASIFTAVFNSYLKEYLDEDGREPPSTVSGTPHAFFDCRSFQVEEKDIVDYFWWRMLDCFRNGVSSLARAFYNTKALHHKNTSDQIILIKEFISEEAIEVDPDWSHLLHGSWIKKVLITKKCMNPKTGLLEECVRHQCSTRSRLDECEENIDEVSVGTKPLLEFLIGV